MTTSKTEVKTQRYVDLGLVNDVSGVRLDTFIIHPHIFIDLQQLRDAGEQLAKFYRFFRDTQGKVGNPFENPEYYLGKFFSPTDGVEGFGYSIGFRGASQDQVRAQVLDKLEEKLDLELTDGVKVTQRNKNGFKMTIFGGSVEIYSSQFRRPSPTEGFSINGRKDFPNLSLMEILTFIQTTNEVLSKVKGGIKLGGRILEGSFCNCVYPIALGVSHAESRDPIGAIVMNPNFSEGLNYDERAVIDYKMRF